MKNKYRLFWVVCFLFLGECCLGQSVAALEAFVDQRKKTLSDKPTIQQTYQVSSSRSVVKPLFVFYKSYLSEQFAANCAFGPSCSQFSVAIIKEKGFFLGYLLTLDRLTRCHGHADTQNSILNLNTEYDIYNDTPDMY